MNKTTEALKLMMEALEMQIHGAGSIIHSKLAWQAGHEALAEPVKQEPVAVEQSAPYGFCPICRRAGVSRERGINGNDTCVIGHKYASSEAIPAEPVKQEPVAIVVEVDRHGDATVVSGAWQLDGGTHTFYAAPVSTKAIRSEALEEAAKLCEQCTGDAIQTETLKLLLQERGRIASVIRGLKLRGLK